MSLHVESFKWVQGPVAECGVYSWLSNLQHAQPFSPSFSLIFSGFLDLYIMCQADPRSRSPSALLCLKVTAPFSAVASPLWSLLWHVTPHSHTATTKWQWQKTLVRHDRSILVLSKLVPDAHWEGFCSFESLVKERPDVSFVFKRFRHPAFSMNTSGCLTVNINNTLFASCTLRAELKP